MNKNKPKNPSTIPPFVKSTVADFKKSKMTYRQYADKVSIPKSTLFDWVNEVGGTKKTALKAAKSMSPSKVVAKVDLSQFGALFTPDPGYAITVPKSSQMNTEIEAAWQSINRLRKLAGIVK
jgi:hypothetical protein